MAVYVRNQSKLEVRLFYGAPMLILVFATLDVINDHDYALAAENMMLATHVRDRQLLDRGGPASGMRNSEEGECTGRA